MRLTAMLAQSGRPSGGGVGALFGDAPRPLPQPSLLERWILETPLYPAAILIIAALVAFYMLNRAGKPRQGALSAAGCLAAAIAVYAAGSLVTTTRETLIAQTRDLVAAVARADAPRAAELLAEDLAVRPTPRTPPMSRDTVLNFIGTQMMNGPYKLEEYRVLQAQATVDGVNTARTQTHVRVTPEAWRTPTFTWWRLDWRKDPDGAWRATAIEVLNLD